MYVRSNIGRAAARRVLDGPHMKSWVTVFIVLAACATDPDSNRQPGGSSAGGKTDGALRDVSLHGESFGAYESMSVHVALGVGGGPRTPAVAFASTTIEAGTFSVEFPSSINDEFDFTGYIDVDGDGSCGDGDVVWRDFYETTGSPAIVIVPDELWPGTEPIDPGAEVYFCGRFGG